jgi:peptide/nickel transport system permease protein
MAQTDAAAPLVATAIAPTDFRQAPGTWEHIRTAYLGNPLAMISLAVLVVLLTIAIGAPIFGRYDPTATVLTDFEKPPSATHWLGTDSAGRDIYSRLVWGSRNSLVVAFFAVTLTTLIGTLLGAVSGYYRGLLDSIVMRVTDGFLSFPTIVLLLMLASVLGPSIINVILVIGLINWTGIARLVRGEFLKLREQDWALAAKSVGVSDWRLIRRHMLPHVVSLIVINATFGVAGAIITEASLSYLGLGVRPPAPSWGTMLSDAQSVHVLESLPWSWLAPGITLLTVVLAVNYVGDTLRRALDPRSRN